MKKRYLLALLLVYFMFISFRSSQDPVVEAPNDVSLDTQNIGERKPDSEKPENTETKVDTTPPPLPLPDVVHAHLPNEAPAGLKNRWKHVSNFEDDLYLDTELHLDNRPIRGYIFKWRKDDTGHASELVAGELPRIQHINGAFPSPSEVQDIVEQSVGAEAKILATQEVWGLDSKRVLTPQAKIEVQTRSRSQRSAGHEYWIINLNTGRIVKRLEADRN